MIQKTFPIKKGQVIELGEGRSSIAKRDGLAYFDGDSVKMLPIMTPSNLDLARECGAYVYHNVDEIVFDTPAQLDAFAEPPMGLSHEK